MTRVHFLQPFIQRKICHAHMNFKRYIFQTNSFFFS
uniref:Uncharacterized protein n=1 Tax=Medicago truncatula TaxID=3880 RepID=I3S2T5_MEDTR|nr:unknown [Medicago truncatula]